MVACVRWRTSGPKKNKRTCVWLPRRCDSPSRRTLHSPLTLGRLSSATMSSPLAFLADHPTSTRLSVAHALTHSLSQCSVLWSEQALGSVSPPFISNINRSAAHDKRSSCGSQRRGVRSAHRSPPTVKRVLTQVSGHLCADARELSPRNCPPSPPRTAAPFSLPTSFNN